MKRYLLLFSLLALGSNKVFAQAMFDPYANYENSTGPVNFTTTFTYDGEYMLTPNRWFSTSLANSAIIFYSCKMEVVSFPFLPCSNWITTQCGDDPNNLPPNPVRNLFLPQNLATWDGMRKVVQSDITASFSAPYTLVSASFLKYNLPWTTSSRPDVLPHSVIKVTLYTHCFGTQNAPVDSVSFVYDNTRGRMRYYPYYDQNYQPIPTILSYDVMFAPRLLFDTSLHTYNQQSNSSFTPLNQSTLNYFPFGDQYGYIFCNSQNLPLNPGEVFFDGSGYNGKLQIPPFALIEAPLLNDEGTRLSGYWDNNNDGLYDIISGFSGIKNNYFVDRPIDLTTINPSERIIYNPSEVSIINNTTLVFPEGYTFRNVNGRYPYESEYIQSINNPVTMLYDDPREAVVSSQLTLTDDPSTPIDERLSYYYITSGCTLQIERCVSVWDAVFVLEDQSSVLIYDPATTYGNFQIEQNGGQVITTTYPSSATACKSACNIKSFYDYTGESISNLSNWTVNNLSQVFPGSSGGIARIGAPIHIPFGQILTIDAGVRLEFGQSGKIVVERGGQLIVNGTQSNPVVFTSACEDMWKGIEVHGNRNQRQYIGSNSQQGYIDLKFAIIENADEAITVAKPYQFGYEGGIVKAANTVFRNNGRDVQFQAYRNFMPSGSTIDNLSAFTECVFETTALPVEHGFLVAAGGIQYANVAHITLNEVRGVAFVGCQFRTVNVSDYHPNARGTGIYSFDGTAKFSTTLPNTFSNLSDAIWLASSGFPAGVTKIDNQQFTGNIHSILLEGLPQARIVNNEIDVPESEADPLLYTIPLFKGYNKPVGIYLLGCYGYDIWDNAINVNDNSTLHSAQINCDDCSYDIVINNTVQTDPNNLNEFGTGTVYRNTLRHASMGIQFEANNGDPITTGTGVDMKCNSMDDFYFNDLTVMGRSGTSFPPYPAVFSYLRDQGDCISPSSQAGNSFSVNCNASSNRHQIYIGTNSIIFTYSDIPTLVPNQSCNNAIINGCPPGNLPNSCNEILGNLTDEIFFYIEYGKDEENNSSTLRQILSSETDGGSTASLLNLIQTGTVTAIRAELNRVSPWLSDTVMISLLNYRDVLSDTGLITFYINNSGLSPTVLQAILTASPAFSSTLIQQLMQAQYKLSERRETEAQLNNSLNRWQQNLHRIVYSAAETGNYSPAIAYLDSINTTVSVRELLRLNLYAGNYLLADSALNRLILLQNSSAGWLEEIAGLAIQQRDSGDSWMQLNSQQVAMLNNFYITPYEKVVPIRTLFRHRIGMKYGIEPYGQPSSGLRTAHIEQQPRRNYFGHRRKSGCLYYFCAYAVNSKYQ
ncbi:MAG: hypothetical protein MUC87_21735 [Bacteroidia bacterium]|nr:hypothetical protein [Bacteroidia bacterium]